MTTFLIGFIPKPLLLTASSNLMILSSNDEETEKVNLWGLSIYYYYCLKGRAV